MATIRIPPVLRPSVGGERLRQEVPVDEILRGGLDREPQVAQTLGPRDPPGDVRNPGGALVEAAQGDPLLSRGFDDARDPSFFPAMEDGGVLGAGDTPGRLIECLQVDVLGTTVGVVLSFVALAGGIINGGSEGDVEYIMTH